jgi:arabinan endo-1,5-alpha-L-arabinosidase
MRPTNYPRYGNTVAGPPGEITWLRIAARVLGVANETYTAYTSLDGVTWHRNGTWTHHLGPNTKIGLVSMARPDDGIAHAGQFQYLRVCDAASAAASVLPSALFRAVAGK